MQAEFTTVPGWLLSLLLAALVTALMIRVMIPIAHRLGLVDRPGGRKAHARATPSIGGLAMVAGVTQSDERRYLMPQSYLHRNAA